MFYRDLVDLVHAPHSGISIPIEACYSTGPRLLHLGLLITIGLPKPTVQNLRSCVMHLLPAVEATALAQGANSVGEGMMNIMEKHLIPAVLAAQNEGHDIVQHRPGAARILRQELVPGQA